MPTPRRTAPGELGEHFAAIRAALEVRESFPPEATALAAGRAAAGPLRDADDHVDRTDLALLSIDPEGSRDLDQALCISRMGSGYLFHYAIADLGSWIQPGDAIDVEARARGATIYCPDTRVPLHPTPLSEGAASLLEAGRRPAVLWSIRLDQRGDITGVDAERAIVVNHRQLSYGGVQAALDAGSTDPALRLIEEVGRLRKEREVARGGVSLELPEQIIEAGEHGYTLRYDAPLPVESFNAQLSLCCGIAAAQLMTAAGFGVLRTLPEADEQTLGQLRRSSRALDVPWPDDCSYPEWARRLDPATAAGAALLTQAARTLRGSGYLCFDGDLPADHRHSAIAASYAHVTAPLRRLVDRFANECVLAAAAGARPDSWVLDAFETLPAEMQAARQRSSNVDRAVLDLVEAATLQHLEGETFTATVTSVGTRYCSIQLRDPAVIATIEGTHDLGDSIEVRLDRVELDPPLLRFVEDSPPARPVDPAGLRA